MTWDGLCSIVSWRSRRAAPWPTSAERPVEGETMASPYRANHVGSLLRPAELIQARTEHAEGRISAEQLHEAEDAAVLQALDLQREAGISIFTDGEYRRPAWSAAIRQA